MNKKILKQVFAFGCLTLALFGVVKQEDESKKPTIMKQMVCAEEIVENEFDENALQGDDAQEHQDIKDAEIEAGEEEYGDDVNTFENLPTVEAEGDVATSAESEIVEYQSDDEMCIWVVGTAKSSIAPDSAIIFARIENRGDDCNSAKNTTLENFNNVISALNEKGIEKAKIQLECFNCTPCYEFSLTKSITGYCSTACISVELDEINSLQEYIDVLTENGACCIDSITYQVADMETEYNNTLAQALQNAKLKAEKISGQEGLKLVKVKEEFMHGPMMLKSTASTVNIADYIGSVEVEARVIAVFEK